MLKNHYFPFFNLMRSFFKLALLFLVLLGSARIYLFVAHGSMHSYDLFALSKAFWLGFRLDVSVVSYIFLVPLFFVFLFFVLRLRQIQKYMMPLLKMYFIAIVTFLSFLIFADLVYFSFFGEHATIIIFGVIDDDTSALWHTAVQNYDVPLIVLAIMGYFALVYWMVFRILRDVTYEINMWSLKKKLLIFIGLFVFLGLLARGSLGLFPLAKYIPDVSTDPFVNKLPQNGIYAMVYAYKNYKKSKSGKYDLLKETGYKDQIEKAFAIHMPKKNDAPNKDVIELLTYKTPQNYQVEKHPPHVVVVIVESFGMPLLEYQSESFNVMGALKKHFEEDIVFTNFISGSNGTIGSVEPLLLNIPARPNATSFGQSKYLNTEFKQAAAKVYKNAGYETSFVYGGDLSWRNIGSFLSRQGFDSVEGKGHIASILAKNLESISHDWGVFDEHLYAYVLQKLQTATKPQFVCILTTNNHPPFTIPNDYMSNRLEISQTLREHITGDIEIVQRRFKDYAYALDKAGEFLENIKSSSLQDKTVVALTADNNTIEGVMRYEEHYTQTKKVPFYLYLPKRLLPKKIDTTVAGSHKDFFPTLYNLTLSRSEYISLGTDLLNEESFHCGFNDAGILIVQDGGFKKTDPMTQKQRHCAEYYDATLAVTEYLIQSHK